jgi:hypothetical protein
MIKATGRLIFPSLSRLLDHIPDGFDFVADVRAWLTPWRKNRVPFFGTQLILFSHDFYAAHLQTQYDEMAGSYRPGPQRPLLETFFYRKLAQLPQNAEHPRLLRFTRSVDPVGQPAHRSRSYSHPVQRVTNAFRATMRRIAPGWWL